MEKYFRIWVIVALPGTTQREIATGGFETVIGWGSD